MTTINLLHHHFDTGHLEEVKAEMVALGSPTIRAIEVAGDIYAVEGCHRLRAAQDLGIPVTLKMLDWDGAVDLDTMDYDDCGWFDDRSSASVAELFGRMFPSGAADGYVSVEIG
jgi:hypothetical protein